MRQKVIYAVVILAVVFSGLFIANTFLMNESSQSKNDNDNSQKDNDTKDNPQTGNDSQMDNRPDIVEFSEGDFDADTLVDNHIQQLGELESYSMSVNTETGGVVGVSKEQDEYAVTENNILTERVQYYNNGYYTYVKRGSITNEGVSYSLRYSNFDALSRYPEEKIRSILENSTIESVNETFGFAEVTLSGENIENLQRTHNTRNIADYQVTMRVNSNDVITSLDVFYSSTYNNETRSDSESYSVQVGNVKVDEPDWTRFAVGEKPLVKISLDNGSVRLQVHNDSNPVPRNASISVGDDSTTSENLGDSVQPGETVYVNSISGDGLSVGNKSVGNINTDDISQVSIENDDFYIERTFE